MDTYIYQAALWCSDCTEDIMRELGDPPPDADSDDYPQGPYPDGGGESDSPAHCDACHAFLENPLTEEGYRCVREAVTDARAEERTDGVAITEWAPFYNIEEEEEEEVDPWEVCPTQEDMDDNATITEARGHILLHIERKLIGQYIDTDTALTAFRETCERTGYWTDLYSVNDHGNVARIDPTTGAALKSWV